MLAARAAQGLVHVPTDSKGVLGTYSIPATQRHQGGAAWGPILSRVGPAGVGWGVGLVYWG